MIKCIEITKINNPTVLANIIFTNFNYLEKFTELGHNKKEITKSLKSSGNFCYLVYDGEKLIGYLVGEFRTLNDNRYVYYISYLYISEQYRGHGLGSQLMDAIIDKCNDMGVKFIVLTCDTYDDKIVKF